MKILTVDDISTLSVKVTEKIEEKNLHNFIRTAIINSDFIITKYYYYHYYYHSKTFTYEIIFYEKLSSKTFLEPFFLINQYSNNSNYDDINVLLVKNYLMVTKHNRLLILKKVKKLDKEEISLYLQQIYKIKEFKIIEVSEEDFEKSIEKSSMIEVTGSYALYPKKSFYFFIVFIISSLLICFISIYVDYINVNNITIVKQPIVKEIENKTITSKNIIIQTIELFKYLKVKKIQIEKVVYSKNKIKTTLSHKEKSNLLEFVKKYKKNIHLKSLIFSEIKNIYTMDISFEY